MGGSSKYLDPTMYPSQFKILLFCAFLLALLGDSVGNEIGKDQPVLEFIPRPPHPESTLIWYNVSGQAKYNYYVTFLDEFLSVYRNPEHFRDRIVVCSYKHPPPPGKLCYEDMRSWEPCTKEYYYNYHRLSPCIFLKLNHVAGWVPEFYNNSSNLPDVMPEQLKSVIQNQQIRNLNAINNVWVTCEGENPADIENRGPIEYFPTQGFPGYYFSSTNVTGYLSPLVAVHFKRPRIGVIINMECRIWAKNIKHDKVDKLGIVHFELLVDS